MTEEPTIYQAGQINRLRRIKYWLKRFASLPIDDQKWLLAEVKRLREELETVKGAAHMPDDYEHGLASWINQHLYGKLLLWTANDGRLIRRSEDIEEIRRLRVENENLRKQVEQLAEALELALE